MEKKDKDKKIDNKKLLLGIIGIILIIAIAIVVIVIRDNKIISMWIYVGENLPLY